MSAVVLIAKTLATGLLALTALACALERGPMARPVSAPLAIIFVVAAIWL